MLETADQFNRLSLGVIEKDKCSPQEAIQKLQSLQLNLVCGEEIGSSMPLQAALLTAVNTAKRAFLGGVHVNLPADMQCLLPFPGNHSLQEVIQLLGGKIVTEVNTDHLALH